MLEYTWEWGETPRGSVLGHQLFPWTVGGKQGATEGKNEILRSLTLTLMLPEARRKELDLNISLCSLPARAVEHRGLMARTLRMPLTRAAELLLPCGQEPMIPQPKLQDSLGEATSACPEHDLYLPNHG